MKLQKKITGAISLITMIVSATTVIGQEIKVWTTETQPARLERQAKMAAEYEASTGVKVEMIPVEEKDMGRGPLLHSLQAIFLTLFIMDYNTHYRGLRQEYWIQKQLRKL